MITIQTIRLDNEPKPMPDSALPSLRPSLRELAESLIGKVVIMISKVTTESGKKINERTVVWTVFAEGTESEQPQTHQKTKKITMTILSITTPDGIKHPKNITLEDTIVWTVPAERTKSERPQIQQNKKNNDNEKRVYPMDFSL